MSGAAAFLIFLAVLITLSIVFNFWIWLVVAGVVLLGIIIAVAILEGRDATPVRSTPRIDVLGEMRNASQRRIERELRGRIEDEWDRQTGLGEDLR
ncbi:MAG: hypothetical protein HY295_05080 [Thaumarchaeota archaeon]|nr:hypothetical protein [Nitrososphaerota archaeon]